MLTITCRRLVDDLQPSHDNIPMVQNWSIRVSQYRRIAVSPLTPQRDRRSEGRPASRTMLRYRDIAPPHKWT